jgi:hypothetical protein
LRAVDRRGPNPRCEQRRLTLWLFGSERVTAQEASMRLSATVKEAVAYG